MNVSDLCERDIVTVPASASVRDAAAAMREHHVGALAVTDPYEAGRVIGLVTDRDLVLDLLATGLSPQGQPIALRVIHRATCTSRAPSPELEIRLIKMPRIAAMLRCKSSR